MDDLIRDLMMKKASEAGGEEWLRSCLQMALPASGRELEPGELSDPEEIEVEMPDGRRRVEAHTEESAGASRVARTAEELVTVPELPAKRSRKTRCAYTPPPDVGRKRSATAKESGRSQKKASGAQAGSRSAVAEGEEPAERRDLLAPSVSGRQGAVSPYGIETAPLYHQRRAQHSAVPQQEQGDDVRSVDVPTNQQPVVRRRSVSSGPGQEASSGGSPLVIWILGHSFIFWAKKRAGSRCYTENLNFDPEHVNVFWFGFRGMKWKKVIEEVKSLVRIWPTPNALILHVGGNDIGKVRTLEFLWELKKDLAILKCILPDTVLIFSEIIPRLLWRGEWDFMDKIRKRINRRMQKYLPCIGGFSYRHVDLEGFVEGLYRSDSVHLSEVGLDIFNLGLQNALEHWLRCYGGGLA
ncbi:uncharacterized protein [Engystomops pustulosus]|uniref:uncharacterized protein n=1 Tax=Engystomops pustulosus TaxID=76066 RepID=UPI003AFB002E